MRALSATLLISITAALAGCSSLPDKQQVMTTSGEIWSKSTGVISAQRERLSGLAGSLSSKERARKKEMEALFEQPFIDPLSRYLEEHAADDDYASYLQQIASERDRRCQVIATRYASQPSTEDNLQRMRRGYLYSCPDQVMAFAARVERHTAKHSPQPPQAPVELEQAVSSRQLNNCYLLYTIKNYTQAQNACLHPAQAGHAKAQHHLGSIARTNADYATAFQWASRSAEQQNAQGQLLLAELHQAGQGTSENPQRALALLQQAASQGLAAAQYQTGLAYRDSPGTEQDSIKARHFLKLAAEQDHPLAQQALAELLLEKVPADTAEAKNWLTRAAQQHSAQAQYQLGSLYASETDNTESLQQAYIWLSLALLNGQQQARPDIERLATQLTAEQLADAQSHIRSNMKDRRP